MPAKKPKQAEDAVTVDGGPKKRKSYDLAFKIRVVEIALQRPANNRIKPTCALYPGIQPCQLRNWIRHFDSSTCSTAAATFAATQRDTPEPVTDESAAVQSAAAECGATLLHALRFGSGGSSGIGGSDDPLSGAVDEVGSTDF